jgi:hypothetical protein
MTTRLELGILRPIDGGFVGALARNPAGDSLITLELRRRSWGAKPARFDVIRTGGLRLDRQHVDVIGEAWERRAGELVISLVVPELGIPVDLVTKPGNGVELLVITAQLDLLDRGGG